MSKPTVVIFRKWKLPPVKEREGWEREEILALFPEIPARYDGSLCVCYAHYGQHGEASYWHCLDRSVPATPEEYAPLLKELEAIGYDNLVTRQKATTQTHRRRYVEAARLRKDLKEYEKAK